MSQDDNQRNSLQQSQERIQERKNNIARNIGEKIIKKAGKKGAKNVLSQKTMGMLLKFAPVLGYVLLAILVVFIVGGLIAFFLTLPGIMSEKLKQFGDSISQFFKDMFVGSDNTVTVSDEEIMSLANYINEMGYDLIGFGFVKPSSDNDSDNIVEVMENNNYKRVTESSKDNDGNAITLVFYEDENGNRYTGNFFDRDGKQYDGSTGKVIDNGSGKYTKFGITYTSDGKIYSLNKLDTSILKSYALSNKSIYVLRNKDTRFWRSFVRGIKDFFSDNNYKSWVNGLVRIYEAEDGLATEEYLKDWYDIDKWGDRVQYTTGHKLKLKKGITNSSIEYDIDGWSGRYGLSEDFLISLHLATLSPDLTNTIVQSFDTEVQVYLDTVKNATALVKLTDTSSDIIGDDENRHDDERLYGKI